MAAATGLPILILKQTLETLGALLADPPLLTTRLLAILEKNQGAVLAAQFERSELALEKSSQARELAEARRVHDEALRSERAAWSRELTEARRLLAIDLDDVARRRAVVNADREMAAVLRERMQRKAEPRKAGVVADVAVQAVNGVGVAGVSSARSAEA
jgi:hypothetical protein